MADRAHPSAQDHVERLIRRQHALAQFGELALRSDDLDSILTEACRLVAEALGTDLAKVMELQPGGGALRVRAGIGWQPGVVGHATANLDGKSAGGFALKTGEPVMSEDIEAEDRFDHPAFLREHGVRALINVLVPGADNLPPFGVLEVDSRRPRAFDQADADFLQLYANLLAAAVERLASAAEARRIEQALRDSEAHFRLLADAIPQIVWLADSEGRIDFLNRQWTAYTGTPPGVGAQNWRAFIHPDDREAAEAGWAKARAEVTTYRVEHRLRATLGEWRWFLVLAEPHCDPVTGGVLRWYGTSTDIHDRKVAEQERDRFFEQSLDLLAVVSTTGGGLWRRVNPAFTRVLGWTSDQLVGRPFLEIVHPEDRQRLEAATRQLTTGEPLTAFEHRVLCADGSQRWIAWHTAPLPTEEVMFCVGRDVTGHREAEAVLRELNDTLERRVEEEIGERLKAEEQLLQGQKMHAVGQLAGGIAHDFNNLLGAVVGNLDLLQRQPSLGDRDRRWVENALSAAERGAKLTAQLLAFSRAQHLELKPLIVSEMVAGLRDLLERTLGPQVQIAMELDNDRVPVLSDATQLEMALLNLAINARDAMPGGGELRIATRALEIARDRELEPGRYVELSVADTGTGMPPEVAARAFDPFFTTKGLGQGTGLGLSQVYGMARQAGGTARIASSPGKGTTVRILLRCSAGLPEQGPESAPAERPRAPTAQASTVLVIDDDADVRRFIVDSLSALGHVAIDAADGQSGLSMLDSLAPDLMIVDFAMPGMDGVAVARAARQKRADLPVIFASGLADLPAIEAVIGKAAPILRKPFRVHDLQAALSHALRDSR